MGLPLLWPSYVIGQAIIFLPCGLLWSPYVMGGGHIYFHAVLECRSEMICTWLAENTGRKNDAKNSHLGTIPQLCRAISSQLRHASTIGKKIAKQQYLLHMSPQYGELRPTGGWDLFGSLEHPSYFQRLSRLGSVTARHVVVGVSQTLRRWREGTTYVR